MKMKQETIKPGRLNNSRCRHFTSSPQGSTARAAKKPPSPNATLPQANFSGASKVEAIPENQLADEMVGRARDADAKAEIDFPLRRDVEVDGRKNLVLLLAHRVEARHGSKRSVVFETEVGNQFRSEEHTSELQSRGHLVCRLLLEKKKQINHK